MNSSQLPVSSSQNPDPSCRPGALTRRARKSSRFSVSIFKPTQAGLILLHEGHQGHETCQPTPSPTHCPTLRSSRGPRPGGPSDDSPARERWVPSPHEHPAAAGRQNPFPPHEHEHPIASPEHDNTPEHEADKPRRTKRRVHLMASRAPFLPETPSHAETPSPPSETHHCSLSSPAGLSGDCLLLRGSVVAAESRLLFRHGPFHAGTIIDTHRRHR